MTDLERGPPPIALEEKRVDNTRNVLIGIVVFVCCCFCFLLMINATLCQAGYSYCKSYY